MNSIFVSDSITKSESGDSEHILRCAKNILTVHATFAALITVELERIIDANQHLISVL